MGGGETHVRQLAAVRPGQMMRVLAVRVAVGVQVLLRVQRVERVQQVAAVLLTRQQRRLAGRIQRRQL